MPSEATPLRAATVRERSARDRKLLPAHDDASSVVEAPSMRTRFP